MSNVSTRSHCDLVFKINKLIKTFDEKTPCDPGHDVRIHLLIWCSSSYELLDIMTNIFVGTEAFVISQICVHYVLEGVGWLFQYFIRSSLKKNILQTYYKQSIQSRPKKHTRCEPLFLGLFPISQFSELDLLGYQ